MQTSTRKHVRWLIDRDLPEVLNIEWLCFEYPWNEDDFLRCLRHRNCIGMVAGVNLGDGRERVVGFLFYELHKSKLHVLNFAVHPDWRREGVGTVMVRKIIEKLSRHRRTRITADVRESNLPAQLFFRACGFKAGRVLRGFYEDSGEDAYRMVFRHSG